MGAVRAPSSQLPSRNQGEQNGAGGRVRGSFFPRMGMGTGREDRGDERGWQFVGEANLLGDLFPKPQGVRVHLHRGRPLTVRIRSVDQGRQGAGQAHRNADEQKHQGPADDHLLPHCRR
jgi:hypothetical protein